MVEKQTELPLSTYMKCSLATADDLSKISNTLLTLSTGAIALLLGLTSAPKITNGGFWMHAFFAECGFISLGWFLGSLGMWLGVSIRVLSVRTLAIARNESALIGSRPLDTELKDLIKTFRLQQGTFLLGILFACLFVSFIRSLK
jgi:hypothetical protein